MYAKLYQYQLYNESLCKEHKSSSSACLGLSDFT